MHIKPIIILRDGLLEMSDKVRTRGKSLQRLVDLVKNKLGQIPVNIAVVHAGEPDTALLLLDRIKRELNCREVMITDLAIPVAANLGPGTIGIIAYPLEGE
jgi:fatty acid-binding protein DegV